MAQFLSLKKIEAKEIQALDMKYHVELKKILKREEIVILKREELEVYDKIMSSFKVTHLFVSFFIRL